MGRNNVRGICLQLDQQDGCRGKTIRFRPGVHMPRAVTSNRAYSGWRDGRRHKPTPAQAKPSNHKVAGSGTGREVPYRKLTLEISESVKPPGRPVSLNATAFCIKSFIPEAVTGVLPVNGLSPAEVIPYCRPSGEAGPWRLLPGNRSKGPKRPRPVLLIPCPAPPGAPLSPER